MDYGKYTLAIKKGDREAFRDYMDSSLDEIFGMVCRLIASEDDARDIVQETYIKVWEKRRSLRSDGSIFSYTCRISINKSYDYLRKIKRRGEWNSREDGEDMKNLVSQQNAEDEINNSEYEHMLKKLTSALSTKQQLVFTLSEIEKLDADEIASLTGLSKTAIKSNLYHARKAVRKKAERIL